MNGCTEKLARVLDQPIRPGVVIQLADKANKIRTPSCAILTGVALNNTGFLQSNSNGNDGTVNADFCGYGYKVDDPMYRCGSGTLGGSGGVADRFFTSADMTPNVKFSHGLLFYPYDTMDYEPDSLSLEIAPLYSGTLTMEIEDSDGVTVDTQSISDTQKIERVTFDITSLHGDSRAFYMNFTLSRGGRFALTGTYADDSFEDILFNNSNILKAETLVNSDLYSQAVPNDQIEVEILDINHEYDPANPQGKFAKLTPDREFFLRLGYRLPDRYGEAEWVEGNWNSLGFYISDKPTYQDQKVKITLQRELLNNKNNVSVPIKHGIYGVGNEVASRNITIFRPTPYINTTALIDKQDYMSADMWVQNAQGRYYRNSGNFSVVANINSLTVRDYVINSNRILDGGVQLDKQPMLKNLIIKQYKNVQSALRLTQSFSVTADDYEWYAPWNKYRARIYNSQELDISCIEMTHTGGIDWTIIYEDVNDSGVLSTSIYVTASSKVVVSGSFNIYGTDSSSTDIVLRVNDEGEDMTIDNPLITSNALVVSCADATKIVAAMREVYKVNMVNDIRLVNGDCVYLDTAYEKNIPVIITGIKRVMPGIKSEVTCRRLNL